VTLRRGGTRRRARLVSMDMTVPCCDRVAALDRSRFDRPCRFARFEIAVCDPAPPGIKLMSDELNAVAAIVDYPVRQILAHV
jgi:hypothetical protein